MDRIGQSNHRGVGWEFVHLSIDDASRVAFTRIMPEEKTVSAIPVRGERNRHGKARVGAENPKIRNPADDREVGDEIFGDPLAVRGVGGGVEIAGALIKSKRVQEINARWRCVSRHLCVAGAYFFLPGKAALEFLASDRLIAAVQAKTANYPNNAQI